MMDLTPTVTSDAIYGLYQAPFWTPLRIKISCITTALLLVAALIALYIYRRWHKKIDPLTYAQQLVTSLDPEQCNQRSDFKRFYATLCNVLKQYTNRGLGWQTHACTDQELIAILQKTDLEPGLLEQLNLMINEAGWVKFANQDTLRSQAHKDKTLVLAVLQALHTTYAQAEKQKNS